jgi:glycerophosphoryl diester phosphodiesterase
VDRYSNRVSPSHPYFDNDGKALALAHRGFSLDGLENSMTAFEAAVNMGYRYVETDAHGTSDGVAVALHDSSLDRTTDGQGVVADLPWREVRTARIGGVEAVPSLEELLGTFPELRVNIDVKGVSGIDAIAAAIERTESHDRVCVASFSAARRDATVALLSKPVATSAGTTEAASYFARGAIGMRVSRPLRKVDALQVPSRAGGMRVLTARHVAAAHNAGRHVHVWTINEPADMHALLNMGVDGLVSDRADLLKDVLMERGQW